MTVARASLLYRLLLAAITLSFAATAVPVRAGTTGSLSGTVLDTSSGKPIADARVNVVSPSQTATTQTDARGNFSFVSLMPDTFTLTIAKDGYEPFAATGISIFADQAQTLVFKMNKSLKTIARVQARSSLSLVRPGTITDVYSVNPAVTQAAAPIGGGGGLNNAYSAIAAMPGAYVPNGQMGVNQTVYIRGGYYDQIGYEYDGVPVNRSFDNYPGHSASTLGQQELQIYAGGGGAGENATGLAGFINQVVKSGTYPGYANVSGEMGSPTFYHDLSAEVGGSTPDRLFSYYAGLSGYNQDFRYLDNFNGAGATSEFPYPYGPSEDTTLLHFWPSVYPTCAANASYNNPLAQNPGARGQLYADPGCFSFFGNNYSEVSYIEGREAVGNFHFGIPHKRDAGRDDVQLLLTSSAQYRQYYSGVDDAGPTLVDGMVHEQDIQIPQWPDYYTFPAGTQFLAPANAQPISYLFPGSPTDRCANVAFLANSCPYDRSGDIVQPSQLPADYRDGRWDTASIVKLQYQKNMGSNAYLRLFGYTFYSNTNRSGASGMGIGSGFGATNYDYEVDAHTRGVQLDFGDQMTSTNLLNATYNYVVSSTYRLQNYNDYNTDDQQISSLTNGTDCYAYETGKLQDGEHVGVGQRAPCNDPITQGYFGGYDQPNGAFSSYATEGQNVNPCTTGQIPAGSPACQAGAAWKLTFTGNQGLVNSVQPAFTNVSVTDEWRPSDRINVSAGLKYSSDNFTLTNTDNPGTNFWFAAAQQEFCYNPVTYQVEIIPEPPQYTKYLEPYATFNCPIDRSSGTPVQTVHPDGKDGHLLLSNSYPPVYNQNYWQPRIGLTDTLNPDTVIRVSAGRYAQEPQNYEIQYATLEPNLAAQIVGFLPFGFTTPFHDSQAQFSNNYDLSYERHFKGTDMSIKVTPYYRYATNQLDEDVYVPTLLASPALNAGTEISDGVEFQFTKGDFNRNGLSLIVSYTYLNSIEKWNNFQGIGVNAVSPYNQYIQEYNALTKAGGGAPCYSNHGNAHPAPKCGPAAILNPYYNMPMQTLLDQNGWYTTGLDYPYTVPNVFALILNFKHNRFAVTPAFTLNEGSTYGTPADVVGLDPRTCRRNQGMGQIPGGVPLAADYTSCTSAATPTGDLYIPNPETGTFDSFGQFRQPWQFNMGMQFSYDLTPRIKATMLVANLVNQCFGGSQTPWTAQYPPSGTVCGYSYNPVYISNFYNGKSPYDKAANGVALNPYFEQPFVPSFGDINSYNYPLPLNLYLQVQVKL